MSARHQGLLMGSPALPVDDLNDIAMVGRYEVWRDAPGVDTTPIPFLTDWSGNGNDLTQSVSGSRPQIVNGPISGFPSISAAVFDGTDDFLISASIAAMTNTDTRWYYCVFRFDSTPVGTNPFAFAGDNTGAAPAQDTLLYGGVGTQLLLRLAYASTDYNQLAVNTPIDFHLASIVADGTNVESKMGAAVADDISAQLGYGAPNGTFKLMLGARDQTTPVGFGNVKIAALFMGNTVLTTLEKTRIEAYMLGVYGQSA